MSRRWPDGFFLRWLLSVTALKPKPVPRKVARRALVDRLIATYGPRDAARLLVAAR